MSQLLLVQAPETAQATAVWSRLLELFERHHGVTPENELDLATTRVAQFPRASSPVGGFARNPAGGSWAACAGTWFYEGRSGRAALEALCAKWRPDHSAEASLDALDGYFCLVLPGSEPGEVCVVTDRLGVMHLYETRMGGCLVVATSSLVLAAALRPEWDSTSVREFLMLGNVFEERTLFQGIDKLGPAQLIRYQRGQRRDQRRWWSQARASYDRNPRRGTVPELAAALEETMLVVAHASPKPLLDLTGGFDSRALYGAALRAGVEVPTMVAGRKDDADVLCAARIVQEMGTAGRHLHAPTLGPGAWMPRLHAALPMCDGECDLFPYARVLATQSQLTPPYLTTVNGSLGGIMKGLWWELLWPHAGKTGHFDEEKIARRRYATMSEPRTLLAVPGDEDLGNHFAGVIRRGNVDFEGHLNTAKMDNAYIRIRFQRWMGRTASSTVRLWDCVTPYVFKRPMEAMLSAPVRERARFRMARRLIEYQCPKLARLPVAEGYPALPVRWNTIHLFGPMVRENWQRVSGALRRRSGQTSVPSAPHEIWQEEEAAEIMQPASMRSVRLYRMEELISLLARSKQPGFGQRGLFERIVSLELLARAVEGNRP